MEPELLLVALRLKSMWVSRTLGVPRGSRVLKVHPEPLPLLLSQPLCSGNMRTWDTR